MENENGSGRLEEGSAESLLESQVMDANLFWLRVWASSVALLDIEELDNNRNAQTEKAFDESIDTLLAFQDCEVCA